MNEEEFDLILQLVDIVVRLLIIAVGGLAIPWIQSRKSSEDLFKMERTARLAVESVEQIYRAYHPEWDRTKKFEEARVRIKTWLDSQYGITIPDDRVRDLIESAVGQINMERDRFDHPTGQGDQDAGKTD